MLECRATLIEKVASMLGVAVVVTVLFVLPVHAASLSETFERTTDGGSNVLSPTNYYIPLDNLSPETTYTLSGLAMLCGIAGSILVLRESQTEEDQIWVPNFEQSLLEH